MIGEETCPSCKKFVHVRRLFQSGATDYRTNFTYKCERCGAMIDVEVEPEPVFVLKEAQDEQ